MLHAIRCGSREEEWVCGPACARESRYPAGFYKRRRAATIVRACVRPYAAKELILHGVGEVTHDGAAPLSRKTSRAALINSMFKCPAAITKYIRIYIRPGRQPTRRIWKNRRRVLPGYTPLSSPVSSSVARSKSMAGAPSHMEENLSIPSVERAPH